jgi:serine/threonine-protein kinase RsbW
MTDVELSIPPDAQYVGLTRLIVTAGARQAGMTNDRLEDLKIAVGEAIASAILARQRAGDEQPVSLSFGITGSDAFAVTIADAGLISDEDTAESIASRNWSADGSLGVTLIRGLADAVDFRGEAGTSVHMRFALEAPISSVRALEL